MPAPDAYPQNETEEEESKKYKRFVFRKDFNPPARNSRSGDSIVRVLGGPEDVSGIYLCKDGSPPRKVASGEFAHPVVTPDGKWAVAAKAKGNWGEPNDIVRIELATGREIRVDIPSADNFDAVAYVPAHGKILLFRAKDPPAPGIEPNAGPDEPEHYLLDAATGKTELVKGAFSPWSDERERPLQPTGKPDEVWIASWRSDEALQSHCTEIARYNKRTFALEEVARIPALGFNSPDMWVDEASNQVYVAYRGHLLRLPLNPK